MVTRIFTDLIKALAELKLEENLFCHLFQRAACPCLFGLPNMNRKSTIENFMYEWQRVDMEVCCLEEFDRDDFTVVVQPFALNYTFPTTMSEAVDLRYLSIDCFHLSQKAHDIGNKILQEWFYNFM